MTMSKLIVCDESAHRRHGVFGVAGVVADLADLAEIEQRWIEAKTEAGVQGRRCIHYSMRWPDRAAQRPNLIAAAGALPIRAVIALLEDSRSKATREHPVMRRDSFIHGNAFDYILQRLAMSLYTAPGEGPHIVQFHHRSDLADFEKVYERGYTKGWRFPSRDPTLPPSQLTSLRERGFSAALGSAGSGPLIEIADLLTSAMTRWADGRAAAHKGGKVPELAELDADARSLIDLFPIGVPDTPPRRRGYSIITHNENRSGKEVLRDQIDRWAADLKTWAPLQLAAVDLDDILF
jgi:hypothetical protein